jgi:hypothetical protein
MRNGKWRKKHYGWVHTCHKDMNFHREITIIECKLVLNPFLHDVLSAIMQFAVRALVFFKKN